MQWVLGDHFLQEIKDADEGAMARAAELAALFTHCKLQPVHLALSLRR